MEVFKLTVDGQLIHFHNRRIRLHAEGGIGIGRQQRGNADIQVVTAVIVDGFKTRLSQRVGNQILGCGFAVGSGDQNDGFRHDEFLNEMRIHLQGNRAGKRASPACLCQNRLHGLDKFQSDIHNHSLPFGL